MTKLANRGPIRASHGAANVRTVCRAIRSLAGVEDRAVPKVSIDDYAALEDLLFVDVEEYLIATGWKMIRPLAEAIPTVVYGKGGREVLIGWSEEFADRPLRVGEIIEMVAEVEGRSALEVYWDFRAARHGMEGDGFVVQPHLGTISSTTVIVEAPVPMYPDDRLVIYAVAMKDAGSENGHWFLVAGDPDNWRGVLEDDGGLTETQRDLIDVALRAVEPIFPGAGWDGGEISMEVDTRHLGTGIMMFAQLCATISLIYRMGDERI